MKFYRQERFDFLFLANKKQFFTKKSLVKPDLSCVHLQNVKTQVMPNFRYSSKRLRIQNANSLHVQLMQVVKTNFSPKLILYLIILVVILTNSSTVYAEESAPESELEKFLLRLENRNLTLDDVELLISIISKIHEDFIDEKELESSIEGLKKLLSNKKTNASIKSSINGELVELLIKGHVYFKKKNYSSAYENFRKVLTFDNQNVDAYYMLGIIFAKNDLLKDALTEFDNALLFADKNTSHYLDIKKAKHEVEKLLSELRIENVNDERGSSEITLHKTVSRGTTFKQKQDINNEMLALIENKLPLKDKFQDAVKDGDQENVNALIVKGYDPTQPWISKDDHKVKVILPVDYARSKQYWGIVSLLIEKSVHYARKENLEKVIDDYSQKYDVSSPAHLGKNAAIILLSTNEFLAFHPSVEPYIRDKDILRKYRAHLEKDKGRVASDRNRSGEISLESMDISHFLILRSFFLTEILFNLKSEAYAKKDLFPFNTEEKKKKLTQTLFEELHVTIETYYSYQIARFYLAPNQKIPKEYKDRIKQAYITSHIAKLLSLPDKQELIYPGGYPDGNGARGHAVYIGFFKQDNKIHVRIDNLGTGCRRHLSPPEDLRRFFPCYLGPLDDDDQKRNYLSDLLKEGFIEMNGENSLKKIYFKEKCEKLDEWLPLLGQVVDNCVRENFDIGARIRLGDPAYKWLVDREQDSLRPLLTPVDDFDSDPENTFTRS